MRCPYCEGKMRKGQLHAVGAGAGLEWKEGSENVHIVKEKCERVSCMRLAQGQDWSGKKALRVCG